MWQNLALTPLEVTLPDFCIAVEKIVSGSIQDCYEYGWDENTITYTLLRQLIRHFKNVRVHGYSHELETTWEAYKYSGQEEKDFGDIALLIRIRYRDGQELEGVGLLEAKRRSLKSTRFESAQDGQLRRIVKNAPRAMLTLYDYERITSFPTSIDFYSRQIDIKEHGQQLYNSLPWTIPHTHCVVVPGYLAIATNSFDTTLYRNSLPLSHQLCNRYFLGFDLEHNPRVIRAAKGFSKKGRIPRYVLTVNIGQGTLPPEAKELMNPNIYTQIFE